jgi:hypothetical protein
VHFIFRSDGFNSINEGYRQQHSVKPIRVPVKILIRDDTLLAEKQNILQSNQNVDISSESKILHYGQEFENSSNLLGLLSKRTNSNGSRGETEQIHKNTSPKIPREIQMINKVVAIQNLVKMNANSPSVKLASLLNSSLKSATTPAASAFVKSMPKISSPFNVINGRKEELTNFHCTFSPVNRLSSLQVTNNNSGFSLADLSKLVASRDTNSTEVAVEAEENQINKPKQNG